jgi:hypothetical protein
MFFDLETTKNLQTRVRNLSPTSTFDAWREVTDVLIEALKAVHLETIWNELERQDTRREIFEAKTALLNSLNELNEAKSKLLSLFKTGEEVEDSKMIEAPYFDGRGPLWR